MSATARERLAASIVFATRHTPLGRGASRRMAWQALRAMGLDAVRSEVFGRPMVLSLDNVSEAKLLLNPAAYSRKEFAFIRETLPRRGGVFVDIGANAGVYSFAAACHAAGGCRILCIEPNPAMAERLRRNLLVENDFITGTGNRIEIEISAVGDAEGRLFLDLGQGLGAAQIRESAGDDTIEVGIKPLAQVLGEHAIDRIDCLKIDVEGFEDRVLGPFFEAAAPGLRPHAMIVEQCWEERWAGDLQDRFEALGYQPVGRTRSNVMYRLAA